MIKSLQAWCVAIKIVYIARSWNLNLMCERIDAYLMELKLVPLQPTLKEEYYYSLMRDIVAFK